MNLLLEDLMAENELLRQQRGRFLAVQAMGQLGHMSMDDGGPTIERFQELEDKHEKILRENRVITQDLHSCRVELLQLAPLRSKISELNTSVEHGITRLHHAEMETSQVRKELQQAKLELTVAFTRHEDSKSRNERLSRLLNKLELEKKSLRISLQETQLDVQNKEKWWRKRLEEDVLAITQERDRALELAEKMKVSLKTARSTASRSTSDRNVRGTMQSEAAVMKKKQDDAEASMLEDVVKPAKETTPLVSVGASKLGGDDGCVGVTCFFPGFGSP